jgi:hypothetical protein
MKNGLGRIVKDHPNEKKVWYLFAHKKSRHEQYTFNVTYPSDWTKRSVYWGIRGDKVLKATAWLVTGFPPMFKPNDFINVKLTEKICRNLIHNVFINQEDNWP